MSRAKATHTRKRARTVLHLAAPPMSPSRSRPPESGTRPKLRPPFWLHDTREDLRDLPAWLCALVTALGLAAGILFTWWKG